MRQPQQGQRFWKIVGLAWAIALSLALLYVILGPGFSVRAWSDALCTSAMLLGIGSAAPFILDVGRGLTLPIKLGADGAGRKATPMATVLQEEHHKREQGMTVTFALALAAVLIGITSIAVSFWF